MLFRFVLTYDIMKCLLTIFSVFLFSYSGFSQKKVQGVFRGKGVPLFVFVGDTMQVWTATVACAQYYLVYRKGDVLSCKDLSDLNPINVYSDGDIVMKVIRYSGSSLVLGSVSGVYGGGGDVYYLHRSKLWLSY